MRSTDSVSAPPAIPSRPSPTTHAAQCWPTSIARMPAGWTPQAYLQAQRQRGNVLGRFADLLLAVESHPAMLFYLDNVESMGADSIAGINRDKGLNENLARETLELHTLGVRSGYSQPDVTSFANGLTGWTWVRPDDPNHGGEIVFMRRLHQPGDQVVLGKRYSDTGLDQGRAVLADLARHPAAAHHIAEKLARHFVATSRHPRWSAN